jgi:hypothetical protein
MLQPPKVLPRSNIFSHEVGLIARLMSSMKMSVGSAEIVVVADGRFCCCMLLHDCLEQTI